MVLQLVMDMAGTFPILGYLLIKKIFKKHMTAQKYIWILRLSIILYLCPLKFFERNRIGLCLQMKEALFALQNELLYIANKASLWRRQGFFANVAKCSLFQVLTSSGRPPFPDIPLSARR